MRAFEIFSALSQQEREARAKDCIDKLAAAEKAAEEKAKLLGQKPSLYLINYRVSTEDSLAKGNENQRRESLVEILRSLKEREHHLSTSTWFATSYLGAKDIVSYLEPILDIELDGFHVSQISPGNRASWGSTDLQS